jgi:PAS domain S-box-containing protein
VLAGDGAIVYESPAVERVLGFGPEERIGLGALGLIHPEDRDRVAQVLGDHRDVPGPFPPLEYRVKDKQGSWRHLEAVGENLLHDLAVGGIVINARDTTERRLTEEALRESRENLQAILDNTTAVIYVKDAEARYTLVNRRFEELFHTTKDRVLGKTDYDFFPKESADAFRTNDLEVLRSEAPLEAEETVSQEDGIHTYVSVKFPLRGPDGLPYATCGIATDITRRKETEERAGFLAELDRTLQPITEPDEVMATAARMLGEHVSTPTAAPTPRSRRTRTISASPATIPGTCRASSAASPCPSSARRPCAYRGRTNPAWSTTPRRTGA